MAQIVIVEDNPDNMKLFRALLSRRGHDVTELTSGSRLVATVGRIEPDLVLLDIQLPDRDGFALVVELREAFGPDLRIIALTAHALSTDEQRAREAGFDGFLTKPIDVARFADVIEGLIDA